MICVNVSHGIWHMRKKVLCVLWHTVKYCTRELGRWSWVGLFYRDARKNFTSQLSSFVSVLQSRILLMRIRGSGLSK
jgi:hypothetical protein